ncbi:30S ribosomal protein THX [Arenimonas sp.]|uniref:30S ribosomal protein THX n=1 Tax=Arenimonas sp. TaxID=1872635 RepID=UPI0039E371A5
MGKGDRRTAKGKRNISSYGNARGTGTGTKAPVTKKAAAPAAKAPAKKAPAKKAAK